VIQRFIHRPVFGVVVVLGLYYVFGTLLEGRPLIADEYESPATEGGD